MTVPAALSQRARDYRSGAIADLATLADADAPPAPERVASSAVSQLLDDQAGILLIGPHAQTARALRRILHQLACWPIRPVAFTAANGNGQALRRAVGVAHATQLDRSGGLLLVVADAERLSPPVLYELELAARAAAEYGGLQFLFASTDDPRPVFRREQLRTLAGCFATPLQLPARDRDDPPDDIDEDRFELSAIPTASWANQAMLRAPPPRSGVGVVLAALSFAGLALAIVAGLVAFLPFQSMPPAPTLPHPAMVAPPGMTSVQAGLAVPPPSPPPTIPPRAASDHARDQLPADSPAIPATHHASLLLMAAPGDTMLSLYARVYRGLRAPSYRRVLALNPWPLRPGRSVVFPAPHGGWPDPGGSSP